jgi:hypothetical protein
MPQIRSVPEPEGVRPPLPPPALPATTLAAIARPPAPKVVPAAPEPPPSAPALARLPPAEPMPAERRPTAATVALLDLPADGGVPDQAQIERIAARYREKPGSVRVVAYIAPPTGGGDPLAGYHAALDRAQTVARALALAGVPPGKIHTEAAPAAAARGAGRIEVQFAP